MAKQVQDIFVRLGVENGEAITALRSSFRELGKVVTPVSANLDDLRQKVLDFGQTNARSEQLIKGQIDALKGLQAQASLTGDLYETLNKDIAQFQSELRGSTVDIDRQREALLQNAKASEGNKAALSEVVRALQVLQQQVRSGSVTYNQFNTDINKLNTQISETATVAKVGKSAVTQFLGVRPDAVLEQWKQYTAILKDASGTAEQLALAQSRLDKLSGVSFIERINALRARTEIINDPDYQSRFGAAARSIPDLPNVTEAYNETLSRLRDNLKLTEIGSREYLNTLIEISNTQRLLTQSTQGLAEALVRNLRAGTTPTTVNTLSEALSQLRLELNNVDQSTAEGSAQFRQYNSDITQLQQQLNRLSSSYRNVADAAIDAAAAQRTTAQTRNLTNLYLRNAETLGTAQTPIVPSTQFAEPIGPRLPPAQEVAVRQQAEAQLKQAQDRMLQLMQQYQIDRVELQNKYNRISLEADEVAFQKSLRQQRQGFETALADFDRRLEAADRRRAQKRKGFTGLGAAQTAGAVISGGIFGGPLGFLGGLGGAAVGFTAGGGPGALGGAFAGSAIGAQADIFRQSLSAAADYASSIGKLRIALAGAVSTTQEYQTALNNINKASQDFNIPLGDATQQFTKLSAAVLGSGGTLQQADTAFRGLSSAIIATGGSQEDLNGALLAAIQVYSKGKVTAEELTGQIGERLAGAFAKFAESTNKSTKQLSESLRKGEVTIADFNKFLKFLQEDYKKTADEIAKSPEQAGARLSRALDDLKLNVGQLLQPIGASFQNFATDAVKALNALIVKIQELSGLTPKTKLEDLLSGKTTPETIKARIAALEQEIAISTPSIGGQLFLSTWGNTVFDQGVGNINYGSRKDVTAQVQELTQLTDVLKQYELVQKRIGNDRKRQADAANVAAEAERKKLLEQGGKAYLQAVTQREEQLFEARKQYEEQIAEIRKSAIEQARDLERQFTEDRLQSEREAAAQLRSAAAAQEDIGFLQRKIAGEDPNLVDFEQKLAEIRRNSEARRIEAEQKVADAERKQKESIADFQKKTAEALNKANEAYAKRIGTIQVNFAKTVASILDDVSNRTAANLIKAQQALELMTQRRSLNVSRANLGFAPVPLPEAIRESGGVTDVFYPKGTSNLPGLTDEIRKTFLNLDVKIEKILSELLEPSVRSSRAQTLPLPAVPSFTLPSFLDTAAQGATRARQAAQNAGAQAISADEAKQQLELIVGFYTDINDKIKQINYDIDLQALAYRTNVNPELLKQLNTLQDTYKINRENLQKLPLIPGKFSEENRAELLNQLDARYKLLVATTLQYEKQKELVKYIQDARIGTGFQEGINQYIESIGTLRKATSDLAVSGIKGIEDAIFSLVTTGTANFREFAANILQETARVIIQQLILRTVLQSIFPPSGGGGGAGAIAGLTNANGNVFATNGIQPFAMGGIVTKPTLFRYANGGVPGTGLMGEAGPEAIIPLQRGPNGRLGVAGGGGTYNVTVNVEAGGATTQTQGDPGQGAQLGRLIAGAVQSELIKQQRPGGLLAQR